MSTRALLASMVSVCLLTNCTPYQPVDTPANAAEASGAAAPATEDPMAGQADAPVVAGAADGGAGDIDGAVAATYKIKTKAELASAVTAMMTLADGDTNGQLTMEEFGVIAPALAQADNSITASAEGGAVANPGAGEKSEASAPPAIRADEFFTETAGSDALISRDELSRALTSRFDTADEDANGELTPDEAQKFAASMLFARE